MQYPIHERFLTWQGEGVHMGRRAFFIRTLGCPVKCPWCDSAGTWHPDYVPPEKNLMSVSQLVEEALVGEPAFVVITGGEPAIFDLTPLTDAFYSAGLPVHLETSGAFEIKGTFDWITVSPKRWKMPIDSSLRRANELKLIIEQPIDISFYLQVVNRQKATQPVIWLHPEWSQSKNPKVLKAICDAVVLGQDLFEIRAGWQLHKLYNVDANDPRSAGKAPLGGNPNRGY